MRNILINASLVLASVFVGLVALELIARSFIDVASPYALEPIDKDVDVRFSVQDSRGFWTLKPGFVGQFNNNADFVDKAVTINKYGNRYVPCADDVKDASARVFLIGDSQTFGWGLSDDDTWANKLQCALNQINSKKYLVYNLGYPGAQVDQIYARAIKQVAPTIRSGDIVIVNFTWNDLVTYYNGPKYVKRVLKNAGLVKIDNEETTSHKATKVDHVPSNEEISSPDATLKIKLTDPLRYLYAPSWRYPVYRATGLFIPSFDSWRGFFESLQYNSAVYQFVWSNARLMYYRFRPAGELFSKIPEGSFSNNFLVLKALETQLKRKGAKVRIQMFPNRLFYDDYYYEAYSKNGVVFPTRDYLGYVGAPLCESLELVCLNRFDTLLTSERDRHSYKIDGHFNPMAAERIANALLKDITQ